ncbi:MAG: gliding motility-associated C-terminal domain-containing protein [Fluviicola sp.]|nr:gliding motility-associated C-terminal domain-containing protein [Fluviicola sp.]
MKRILLILLLIAPYVAMSQGATCAGMDPICTDVGASFTANTGTTSEAGNNYGCLSTQPNPSWYYFEVATNGNIDMSLTAGSDIDFIIWGPYANLTAAQANCGTLGTGNQVDCSYSSTNTETPSIPGALAGEVYIMLITNYANVVQNITLTQTGGSGSTDCSIVTNPPCFMSYFEANVSACDVLTDTYSISGQIDFDDPPSTGNLIVQDCNGNQVIVASAPFTVDATGAGSETYVLNGSNANGLACDVTAFFDADPTCTMNITYTAPICLCFMTYITVNIGACNPGPGTFDITGTVGFQSPPTTGTLTITDCNGNSQSFTPPFTSPLAYSLPGLNPDGTTGCSITATFSAAPTCTITSPLFNYPADCNCPVDAGSFTGSIVGSTNNQTELCFGDQFVLTPNGDFIPPDDIGDDGTFTYTPGMWFLLYSCPPTIQAPAWIFDDPCYLGQWNNTDPFGPWTIDNIYGDNTTYYFVPVTLYDYTVGVVSYFAAGTLCYDMGPAYPITFLQPITATTTIDCFAGTATATISGGAPSNDGSSFNIVIGSLTPSNASFVNTSTTNGGTITIDGLLDGDVYSYDVEDGNGCPITVTGTFTGLQDASFTYDFKYCADDPNPLPIITGVAGGNFTATPAGMVINPSTGLINIAASTPGVYTIQYVSPAINCWGTETFTVVIDPLPLVVATEDSPICDDGVSIINLGETGGEATSWTWTTSGASTITTSTDQAPTVVGAANGETFTVTVIDVATGCSNTDMVSVTVNPMDDPTFTTTDFCIGSANAATVTGTPGGTFTFNPLPGDGATINASTGEVVNGVAGTTYSIEYITNGICLLSLIVPVTVNSLPIVTTADVAVCLGGSVNITATGAIDYIWSPGTYLNTTIGATVISTPLVNISYTVTGTDANGCQNTAVSNVTVSGNAPINAGPDVTLCVGAAATLTATGGVTYSWDNGLGVGNNFNVTPAVTTTYIVNGTDANGCSGTDQVVITVNPLPVVNAGLDQAICVGASVTLSGSGATSYVWDNGVVDGVAFTPGVGSVTYTVIGTDVNGCVNTDQVVVNVNPLPVVNAGIDQTICVGASVTLSGSGATSYVWDNGVVDGVAFTPGIGTVTYTVTGTDGNGCVNTDQVDVIVNPLPVVNAGIDQTICVGASVTLSGSGATSYVWDNGVVDGVAFTPGVGTVTYTVTGTDGNGCVNTDQVDVIVNPLPVVNAGIDQTICVGASVTLSGSGVTSYVWDNGVVDGVAFTPGVGTVTYTVIGTDGNGCVDSDQVDIIVNPLPIVFAGNDIAVCENDQIILTASGATTYVWDNGVTNGISFNAASGTYTVIGTDQNGCIASDAMDVYVEPTPVIVFSANVPNCEPFTVTLINNSTTQGTVASCVWQINNGVTLTGCGPLTYTFDSPGTYDVTLTTTTILGCTATETIEDLIYLQEPPIASFVPVTTSITTLDTEISFTNTSTGAVAYEWTFGDETAVITETNPTHTFPNDESGTYSVMLVAISSLGCTDTAYAVVNVDEELIFYVPNTFTPDDDAFNDVFKPIFTSGFDPFDYTLLIFNRWGQIVFESHDTNFGWDGSYASVPIVQDGTYTWKIIFKTNANDERKVIHGHVNVLR